jgi:hypothetical protein
VIDAQDEPYTEALARLHETVTRAHRVNPHIFFEVGVRLCAPALPFSVVRSPTAPLTPLRTPRTTDGHARLIAARLIDTRLTRD